MKYLFLLLLLVPLNVIAGTYTVVEDGLGLRHDMQNSPTNECENWDTAGCSNDGEPVCYTQGGTCTGSFYWTGDISAQRHGTSDDGYWVNYTQVTGYTTFYTCDGLFSLTECGGGSSGTTTIASSSPMTYGDWLFTESVQIFLLSFIALGFVFSLFKRNKR